MRRKQKRKGVIFFFFIIIFLILVGMITLRCLYGFEPVNEELTDINEMDQRFEISIKSKNGIHNSDKESTPKSAAPSDPLPAQTDSVIVQSVQPLSDTSEQEVITETPNTYMESIAPSGVNELPDVPFG